MADIKKLQEAFELLLNEEDEAADEVMHRYFVGLARKINEEYEDAELEEADLDMDMEDGLRGEIEDDMEEIDSEEGVREDDYGNGEMDDMDMGDGEAEADLGDEMGGDMEGDMEGEGEADAEEIIMNLETALDQLKDMFDEVSDGEEPEFYAGDEGEGEEGGEEVGFDLETGGMDDDEGEDFGDEEEEGEDDMEESMWSLDEDEDLDEGDDELDEEDELDESLDLTKVAAPSNTEGKDAGAGGSFATNTKSVAKAQGQLKAGNTKAVASKGGETKGYPNPKKIAPKNMNVTTADNKVPGKAKTSKKKVPAEGKGDKEAGAGKSVARNKSSLLGKKGTAR